MTEKRQGAEYNVAFSGKTTFRRQSLYPGVSIAGCVASYMVRALVNGVPSGAAVLTKTSGTDAELSISHTAVAQTIGAVAVPVGSGVITLELYETTTEALPVGEYLHELKLIWPESGGVQRKEPIFYGTLRRVPTINNA
jgi:hypothetical protein